MIAGTMNAEIDNQAYEAALRRLIGLPLSDMWRYVGFQRFEFGMQKPTVNRRGQAITRADDALVVGCDWTVTDSAGGSVGSLDYDEPNPSRDAEVQAFLAQLLRLQPIVKSIKLGSNGDLLIELSDGYSLRLETDATKEDPEQWRLMFDRGEPRDVVWTSDYL